MKYLKEFQINEGVETRISLSEEDFRKLIAGEIIIKGDIHICLQDIGYDNMIQCVVDQQNSPY